MGVQDVKAIIERAVELWNAHDEGYFGIYADDAGVHGFPPQYPPNVEGMKSLFHQMWEAFPDGRVDILRLAAEEDLGAIHLRFSGTHEREFLGSLPTGNWVEVEGMAFVRFADGKIAERWTRMDDVALLTQLELMPAPAGAPA